MPLARTRVGRNGTSACGTTLSLRVMLRVFGDGTSEWFFDYVLKKTVKN
jgi:hypothetical protein